MTTVLMKNGHKIQVVAPMMDINYNIELGGLFFIGERRDYNG